MIQRLLQWLLSFFEEDKSKEQVWLESKVEQKEKELQEISDEKSSPESNVDYLNK